MDFAECLAQIMAQTNAAPFSDQPTESKGSVQYRVKNVLELARKGDYITSAPDEFAALLENGSYLSPINECNTSLDDIAKFTLEARSEMLARRNQHECTDYVFLRDNVFFMFLRGEEPKVYVGNPQSFNDFAPLLGYSTISRGLFDQEKVSPERHIVIEFQDSFSRERLIKNIANDMSYFPQLRNAEGKFLFSLYPPSGAEHEKCLWDIRSLETSRGS